jgi:hypothetical protein
VTGYSIRVADTIRAADGGLIGVQLGRICLERDLPVVEVARTLGVSRQTVYGWFSGTVMPQPHYHRVIEMWIDESNENPPPS